jgi:aspartyl/asparaginyl beta-hydroxylase (cupin superfamily)
VPEWAPVETFDRDRFPFLAALEQAAPAIAREALALEGELFRKTPETEVYSGDWRTFLLVADEFGDEYEEVDLAANRGRCPATTRVLDAVEGVTGAGFTWLGPGSELTPHKDPRDDHAVRCHLAIRLPPNERSGWPEGTARLLETRVLHALKNDGSEPRITLLVDVMMPFEVPTGAVGVR